MKTMLLELTDFLIVITALAKSQSCPLRDGCCTYICNILLIHSERMRCSKEWRSNGSRVSAKGISFRYT